MVIIIIVNDIFLPSFHLSPRLFFLVAPPILLILSRDHHNQPHDPAIAMPVVKAPPAPRAMADAAAAVVTSPRFTLDEAHRAAAVHDLLVYGLVGGEFGWEWEGLSKTTTRTRVEGNVEEQLRGSGNVKGKVSTSTGHTYQLTWLTGAEDRRFGAQMGHGGVSLFRESRGINTDTLPVRDRMEALQDMHDEDGPSEPDVCWEWTIRK